MKAAIRKSRIHLLWILGVVTYASAQNIGSLYLKMPERLEPILPTSKRIEMLEYYKAGLKDSTQNKYGGYSYIQHYDTVHNYLHIVHSKYSDCQLKVFQVDAHPFIGVIETVHTPITSSCINFYDTQWQPISVPFELPDGKAWINHSALKSSNMDTTWIQQIVKNKFVALKFEPTQQSILAINHNIDYLNESDSAAVSPYIRPQPLLFKLEKSRKWVYKP